MPRYQIRQATEADLPELAELGQQMHNESNFSGLTYDPELAQEYGAKFVDNEDRCFLLAVDSQRTIGFISGQIGRAMFGPELIATEDLLYVVPEERGMKTGVTTELLRRFCLWSAERGAARVSVANVAGANDEAFRRLLGTYGFRPAGTVMYLEVS